MNFSKKGRRINHIKKNLFRQSLNKRKKMIGGAGAEKQYSAKKIKSPAEKIKENRKKNIKKFPNVLGNELLDIIAHNTVNNKGSVHRLNHTSRQFHNLIHPSNLKYKEKIKLFCKFTGAFVVTTDLWEGMDENYKQQLATRVGGAGGNPKTYGYVFLNLDTNDIIQVSLNLSDNLPEAVTPFGYKGLAMNEVLNAVEFYRKFKNNTFYNK